MASSLPLPAIAQTAAAATQLKSLHVAGNPLVLTNVWDISSLNTVLSLSVKPAAVATSSYAVAEAVGLRDPDLTLDGNIDACAALCKLAHGAGVPITLDLRDGYGDRIEECIRKAIGIGASGANIEDALVGTAHWSRSIDECLYPLDVAVDRIRRAMAVAKEMGVPDFVINARTDVFVLTPGLPDEDALKEAIARGKAYLDAGATTIFVWGHMRGLRDHEIKALSEGLGGRLSVRLGFGNKVLSVNELKEFGVARISVGRSLWTKAMDAFIEASERILRGGRLDV